MNYVLYHDLFMKSCGFLSRNDRARGNLQNTCNIKDSLRKDLFHVRALILDI